MIRKILITVLTIVVLVVAGFYFFVEASWDKNYDWPAPGLMSSSDSSIIAKGKYLVTGPAHCNSCHVSGFQDMVDGDKGKDVAMNGGLAFPLGPLGVMFTKNLTSDKSTGLGRYTDEQIFRMLRHGIRPDGKASMPVLMPYWNMADEDLIAIVSYLRSLEPIHNNVPDSKWTFMGKAVRSLSSTFKPIEKPTPPSTAPAMAATVERGEYLARSVTNCVGCHTQRDIMTYEATGPEFAGGMEFEPWTDLHKHLGVDTTLWIRTPNITPDPESAFSKFKTSQDFINRFKQGKLVPFSPMDWGHFSRMSDEDLTAIWMFLNSLQPVKKDVGEIVFKKES